MTHPDKIIQKQLDAVRQEYLKRMTSGNVPLLRQVEEYITRHNGKMLRPTLTLLSAQTLGNENLLSRRTLLLATAVEILHNASLLHDDVVDCATQRRGQPSVNTKWNNAVAILVGDWHFAQLMQLLDEVNDPDASRIICRTVQSMSEAEILAQQLSANSELTISQYISIIDGKTAYLFSTACAIGNPQLQQLGLHYGRLFQIYDDIHDNEAPPFADQLLQQEQNALKQQLAVSSQQLGDSCQQFADIILATIR